MKEMSKVKVIKRQDVHKLSAKVVNEDRSKREGAREMVTNVTNWVTDLQVRKSSEAKLAFEQLFSGTPSPSES
jgi:hypothetical protein